MSEKTWHCKGTYGKMLDIVDSGIVQNRAEKSTSTSRSKPELECDICTVVAIFTGRTNDFLLQHPFLTFMQHA